MQEKNIGSVVQIIGPVLDIRFPAGHLSDLLNAIEIERDGGKLVCEVAQQLGDDVVRCIAMSSTDGMVRGMEAVDTGSPIKVPVGNETLGREIYDAFTAEVVADVYLLAHATSPFIRPATIAAALHKVTDEGYDSAFSAERMQTFAWYRGEPLNYALDAIPRTQEIEPVFVETSAFFIFRREIWCDLHQRIGRHPYVAVVDRIEGIDIDYPEDFALAEVIAKLPNR